MSADRLHPKFEVKRTDPAGQLKHQGCFYFVLDLSHDWTARRAAHFYAGEIERLNPELARDLRAAMHGLGADTSGVVRTGDQREQVSSEFPALDEYGRPVVISETGHAHQWHDHAPDPDRAWHCNCGLVWLKDGTSLSADIVADTDCPDCRDDKHAACTGGSWDQATDAPAACPCWVRGHQGDEIPAEVADRLAQIVSDAAEVMRRQPPADLDQIRARNAVLAGRTHEQDMADAAGDRYEAQLDRQGGEA